MTGHLRARPLTLAQANDAVEKLHRHHKPDRGHRFSIGAYAGGEFVGAIIVGRPKGRGWDPYQVAEVTRLVTDGHPNACSFLYARAARAAAAMGFTQIITYTLVSEPGTSLRASGWRCDGQVRRDGVGWNNRPGRKEENQEPKQRWCKELNAPPEEK